MDSTRPLQAVGAASVLASLVPAWFSVRSPLCPSLGSGGQCVPNPYYLVPGLLAALVGLALIVFARRKNAAADPGPAGA